MSALDPADRPLRRHAVLTGIAGCSDITGRIVLLEYQAARREVGDHRWFLLDAEGWFRWVRIAQLGYITAFIIQGALICLALERPSLAGFLYPAVACMILTGTAPLVLVPVLRRHRPKLADPTAGPTAA